MNTTSHSCAVISSFAGASSSPIAQVVAPGASIQAVTGRFSGISFAHEAFAPWLLHWLEDYTPEPVTGSSSSTAHGDGTTRVATLLRQLWQLLQGRSYSTWMFWLATALLRAGEEDTACEAAAQGLLPSACNFWDMRMVKDAHTSCFEALLPLLARSSEHPPGWQFLAQPQYLPQCWFVAVLQPCYQVGHGSAY